MECFRRLRGGALALVDLKHGPLLGTCCEMVHNDIMGMEWFQIRDPYKGSVVLILDALFPKSDVQ